MKTSSRVAYRGRPAEHLAYLREELTKREKAGVTSIPTQQPAKAAAPAPAKQDAPPADPVPDQAPQSTQQQEQAPPRKQPAPATTANPRAMKW
jgi:hypothetical protein